MRRIRLLQLVAVVALAVLIGYTGPAAAQFVSNYIGRNFTSTAPSGVNGFACKTNGCRVDLGSGPTDYLYSDGANVQVASTLVAAGNLQATAGLLSSGAGPMSVRGTGADGASAIGVKLYNSAALVTTGAKIASFYSDNGVTERAYVDKDGGFTTTGASGHVVATGYLKATLGVVLTTGQALPTCAVAYEGAIYRLTGTGGTGTLAQTRLCACVSDGAASPIYSWRNLISGVAGNATTCNP